MKKGFKPPSSVDAYIEAMPVHIQPMLMQMRKAIKVAAPAADESISYGMPGYRYAGKPLVYFGGFTNHIGFFATPAGHEAFKKDLSKYKTGKGSVQFPVDEKLPIALIKKIVKFRVKKNEKRAQLKQSKK